MPQAPIHVPHGLYRAAHSATNEITEGALQSFTVDTATGVLTLKDTVATGGNGPTYAEVLSTGEVSGMNVRSHDLFPALHKSNLYASSTVERTPFLLRRPQRTH